MAGFEVGLSREAWRAGGRCAVWAVVSGLLGMGKGMMGWVPEGGRGFVIAAGSDVVCG